MIKPQSSNSILLYALSAALAFIGALTANHLSHAESGEVETIAIDALIMAFGLLTLFLLLSWYWVREDEIRDANSKKLFESAYKAHIHIMDDLHSYSLRLPPPPPIPLDRPSQGTYTKIELPIPDKGRIHWR